jgi:hypothetical protein
VIFKKTKIKITAIRIITNVGSILSY